MTMDQNGIFNYKKLEKKYAKFANSDFAIAVNSGTSAIHLSLVSLGIGVGDEVIVPDFTMIACAYAVYYTGAMPVFVDCGKNMNIDTRLIEEKITKRTKAIMAVHIYGRLCDMDAINKIAKKYDLYVIEDACEAQGCLTGPADLTCYSLYQNKIVNSEEGGIITTDNLDFYNRLQRLKNMSFTEYHNYWHDWVGFNYRMPESQAKLALKSLKDYKKNAKKRRLIETWFDKYLPKTWQLPKRDAVWVYDFIPDNVENTKKKLIANKIQYREFFKPMSRQSLFYTGNKDNFWSSYYGDHGLYFPINLKWTKNDIIKICKKIT